MKISTNEAALGEETRWLGLDDVNYQNLADLWSSGVTVAAQHGIKTKTKKSGFGVADAVMVSINLNRLPLAVAMNAAFTQEYASVAACNQDPLGGELLLAFELPSPVTDAKAFVRIMAGLETLYAGSSRHKSALEPYGLRKPGEAQVLGRKLNDATVRWLDKLGLETKERLRGDGGFIRSRHSVDRSTVIVLANGDEAVLEQLPPDTQVFCPVHIDRAPRAVVHWYQDGTPGIQCDHCRRTYAAPNTHREYDFGHFDQVVAKLAANQESVIDRGLESNGDDVITYSQQYLPAQALVDAVTRPLESTQPLRTPKLRELVRRFPTGATMYSWPPLPERATQFELVNGITFVKSPKGTNKTGILESFVAECKKENLGVLMIGHRRSLLQAAAERLKIDCYFVVDDADGSVGTDFKRPIDQFLDAEPVVDREDSPQAEPLEKVEGKAAHYRFVEPKRRYAVCLDSLVELDPQDKHHQYSVVVIDEVEQVFAHLVGSTLKDRRRDVFAKLRYYLRNAHQVVLLDADLNMITMDTVFEIFHDMPTTPARFIINQPNLQRGETMMYSSRSHLVQVLADRVRQGKKIYVATNSRSKAYVLEKLVRENSPQSRVAVVTSDNTQTKDVQSLLASICDRFEHDLDVLIASPAIGTGIDISYKDANGNPRVVVDCVFGAFEGNIVTHFDIDQQLMRVRHPGEVHVWVDGRPLSYETDIGCIKHELDETLRKTSYILRYRDYKDGGGKPVYGDDCGLVNIWARVLAASRGSKNRLAPLFTTLRGHDGWQLTDVANDAEASKAGKEAMCAAQEAQLQEREECILAAEKIEKEEATELQAREKRGAALTEAERWALERYQIERFYDDEISAELVKLDEGGRTRQAVMRLECLTSNQTWFANKDTVEIENSVMVFDRRRYLVQREILEALFMSAGIFDAQAREFRTDVWVANGDLRKFLAVANANAAQIESIFGVTLYADRQQNPFGQLKGLLGLVGLTTVQVETVQKDGKKTRRYAIDADRLDALTGAVMRRDSRYKRDDAKPHERLEDRVALGTAKELQAYIARIQARKVA